MHGYNIHQALYQYWEIHGHWDKSSGHRVGPIWPFSENVLNLTKSSSILPCIFEKKQQNSWFWCPRSPLSKVWKFMVPGAGGLGP